MKTLDLCGTWKLRWSDGQRGQFAHANADKPISEPTRYIDAIVPGEVHLDAQRAGMIGDFYTGTGCLEARWVEELIWSYRRDFDVPTEALDGRSWLQFDGLDLVATIVLNGVEIGKHSNFFHPCRIETTGKLRAGSNTIVVHLDPGLYEVADKPIGPLARQLDQRLHKRMWLRKPQCNFVWDWSARLINAGIFKPVRLEWTQAKVRADQFAPLAELSADLKRGSVRARWFVEGLSGSPVLGTLEVELVEAGIKTSVQVEIRAGLNPIEAKLHIADPKLWWSVNHGPQNLYTLKATLKVGADVIDAREATIGFRHVRVNQDPHPVQGRYFIVEVNGKKIFAKGGNFVPADLIFSQIDRSRYEKLVDLALESNFNFLRVWGGGLYEADEFYEICNRKGIMVWQEFIFACDRYPTYDEVFHHSVKTEATWNIRRLCPHPSLVIWCGNNEMEVGSWEWGFDKAGAILPDYAMYHLTLPRLLADEDPTRYYQPSSPFSPDHERPNADHTGDQHPWSVGFSNTDFRDYRKMICRFPNEGGILGPTSLPTMLAAFGDKPAKIHNFAFKTHDNGVDCWGEPSFPDNMLIQWLGKNIHDMTVEEFTYWGGVVQGEGLREYCDNFRRRMFDSAAAIFWMYNDNWPCTRSWTTVDYYLRRTPSFHPVRRAMQPVTIVVAQEADRIVVFGINETDEPVAADLRFGVVNLGGSYPIDRTAKVTLTPNASVPIASFPASEWTDPTSSAAFAILTDSAGGLIARHRLFLPFFKEIKWPAAAVSVTLKGGKAVFTSSTFAWNVCIDLSGDEALPDNFFDVYPGVPHEIAWSGNVPPKVLRVGNL